MFSLDNEKFLCAEEENKIIGYAYDEDYSEYQYMMLEKFGRTFEVRQKKLHINYRGTLYIPEK